MLARQPLPEKFRGKPFFCHYERSDVISLFWDCFVATAPRNDISHLPAHPNVDKTTRLVVEKSLDLDGLIQTPYDEAKAKLMECPGIGPKIADCILVFSLEKIEAFPIDVWVRRALAEWYFPGEKTPTNRVLEEWAHQHFGRYGGYAQQYLFHGRRLEK